MKVRVSSFLVHCLVAASLLASLFINAGTAAALPDTQQNSPAPAVSSPKPAAPDPLNVVSIPFSAQKVTVDGDCNAANEYLNASFFAISYGVGGPTGTVYLQHDASNLYVCLVGPVGTFQSRFGSLYLDPQANGSTYTFAQQDDFALRVNIPGSTEATFRGNEAGPHPSNSYIADPTLDTSWTGQATSNGKNDQVEYAVPLKNFGIEPCGAIFGLAMYHHWFDGTGNDYGWPSNNWFDQPRTWQLVTLGGSNCQPPTQNGRIAYVFRGNTLDATTFYNLLASQGYTVTLVPLSVAATTDFSVFDEIIIADDTGSLNNWGTAPDTAAQVAKITAPNKPILGLGEGGYAFFGQLSLFIGWPHGWHGPQDKVNKAGSTIESTIFTMGTPSPIPYYLAPTNSVGIYINSVPGDVIIVGKEEPTTDHASLTQQDCRFLWGNSGNPLGMLADGKTIFLNVVGYLSTFQCNKTPPPSPACYSIQKTAIPDPTAGNVNIGSPITYTIKYKLVAGAGCVTTPGKIADQVPVGSTFVTGSATGGVTPDATGVLTWPVTITTTLQSVAFTVNVSDTACTANPVISNTATLLPSGVSPITSNPAVQHTVNCPTIGLPNTQPMYAETELTIDPYPVRAGVLTTVSLRVQNLTGSPQTVTAQFQSSPAHFGIGLSYATFGTSSTTLPANSTGVLSSSYIPTISGNECIQALASTPGMTTPLLTQSCLDVTEDFSLIPRTALNTILPVRNNTGASATVNLVVDNTCPGWSAGVNPTSITGLGAGLSQNVTLSVTPPSTGLLGSGCHIDLQAWIGDKMIGGIRKVDIAPVHLPLNVTPAWEEPEITFQPDPPVVGVPSHVCIQLVNPLSTTRTVTVDFSVADFGAGIGFTPAASTGSIVLPPNSIATYCADWTPLAGGTLHRCVLATLKQAGYIDQTSQHNIDVRTPSSSDLSGLAPIPFTVGNRDLLTHTLTFQINQVGIHPVWQPTIEPLGGGAPFTGQDLAGGGQLNLQLNFILIALDANPPLVAPSNFRFGFESHVEVTMLLDGVPSGGFTVELSPLKLYLPSLSKK